MPRMIVGSAVRVGVLVADCVRVGVGEFVTGVDVGLVAVAVIVPSDVAAAFGVRVGVDEGRGLLVTVRVRLGVKVGSGDGFIVGVDVEIVPASFVDGKPDPIKMKRVPAKAASVIPLKAIPRSVGRSRNASRVTRPRILASIK